MANHPHKNDPYVAGPNTGRCKHCGLHTPECVAKYTPVDEPRIMRRDSITVDDTLHLELVDAPPEDVGPSLLDAGLILSPPTLDTAEHWPGTLAWWAKKAHDASLKNGFWENDGTLEGWERNSPTVKLMLMDTEIAEVVAELRDGHQPAFWYINQPDHPTHPGKPEGPAMEIADLFIRMLDYCGKYGIDLEKITRMKFDYNATRPFRHGKTI